MISILCPSFGRPELARRMLDSVRATVEEKTEVIFYVSDVDERQDEYKGLPALKGPEVPPIMKWNLLAQQCKGDMLLHAGDDMIFETKGWDRRFHEAAYDDGIFCMVTADGRGERSWPHVTIGRGWYDTLGYFVPPFFFNWCGDLWTTRLAEEVGRLVEFPDIMFRHAKVETKDAAWRSVREGPAKYWNARDNLLMKSMGAYFQFDAGRLKKAMKENHADESRLREAMG